MNPISHARLTLLAGLAAFIALPSTSNAQGDTCAAAAPIAGAGSYAVNMTGFAPSQLCPYPTGVDGFFEWTVPANGHYRFSLGPSWMDGSHIRFYGAGTGCAASYWGASIEALPPILDAELIAHSLAMGELLQLQVCSSAPYGIPTYTGTLSIEPIADPCPSLVPDVFEPNDTCATASPLGPGRYIGLNIQTLSPDYYSVLVQPGETLGALSTERDAILRLRRPTSAACDTNLDIEIIHAPHAVSATNRSSTPVDLVLQVATNRATPCLAYDLELRLSGGPAASLAIASACATRNMYGIQGDYAYLLGEYSPSSPSTLHLEGLLGPPGHLGLLIAGDSLLSSYTLMSGAALCIDVGGPFFGIYRWAGSPLDSVGAFDANGTFVTVAGHSSSPTGFDVPLDLPHASGSSILPGTTLGFQLWFRDIAGTPLRATAATNMLIVTF